MLKYKKYLFLFIIVPLLLLSCKNINAESMELNPISNIKKNYTYIEKNLYKFTQLKYKDIGLYKNIDKTYSIEAEELTQVALINMFKYYQKNLIQKIVLNFDTPLINATSNYYYKDNKLFFVHKIIYEFKEFKYSNNFDKKEYSKYEHRFYFHKNKMIKWIKNKQEVNPASKEWQEQANKITHDSNVYLHFKTRLK